MSRLTKRCASQPSHPPNCFARAQRLACVTLTPVHAVARNPDRPHNHRKSAVAATEQDDESLADRACAGPNRQARGALTAPRSAAGVGRTRRQHRRTNRIRAALQDAPRELARGFCHREQIPVDPRRRAGGPSRDDTRSSPPGALNGAGTQDGCRHGPRARLQSDG